MKCPCDSEKLYADCCGPFVEGKALAPSPEALMRSRYTAYSQANIDYISKTMKGPAAKYFNAEEAEHWAKTVVWKGLKVIDSKVDQLQGWVEFIATYSEENNDTEMHELSEFHFENGQWYYVNGKIKLPNSHPRFHSVGRNDPCPCGSDKKFKKCCGK
jgi:SEC-C motif-containing protein